MFDHLIQNLQELLEKPLPGKEVQYHMAHQVRQLKISKLTPPDDVRQAGVLTLLYPKKEEIYITLIRRTNRGSHSGQVAFPGGGVEEQDQSLAETAVREAHEEVGIRPEAVKLIGGLTDLYIPVSNSMVNPYLGYLEESPHYRIQESEVQYVIEAPLNQLMDDSRIKFTDLKINQSFTLKDVPYFDIEGHIVWGATAMILNEFKMLARKSLSLV